MESILGEGQNCSLFLGSSSLFRKRILEAAGFCFTVLAPDYDESLLVEQDPEKLSRLLAEGKSLALRNMIADGVLLSADQVVVCQGEIRGKPASRDQAREFLYSYREAPATTYSALCVYDAQSHRSAAGVSLATIYLGDLTDVVIEQILDDGTVFHCSGGFAIEHPLMQPLVRRIDGSLDSVQGMPLQLFGNLLKEIGRADLYRAIEKRE